MLGEELGKVGINFFLLYHFYVLTIVPKSWTSLCELIHFISRLHLLHWVDTYGCGGWRSRMQWPKESNAVTGGDECDSWRRRMQWPKETNAVAEGDECCGWRRRLRRINKTLNATFSDVSLVFKLKFHSSTITILQYITFPSIRTIIINRTFMELSTIVEIIEAY